MACMEGKNLSRREYSEACFTILHMIDVNYYIFAKSKREHRATYIFIHSHC